jgi:alkaline phosphatase D
MQRRQFLQTTAAATLFFSAPARAAVKPKFSSTPFTLGVASGYPRPDGFSLWTRLAPKPLEPRGGLGQHLFEAVIAVRWEVAEDEQFGKIVARGVAYAEPDWAHSVHVDVFDLPAGRRYFYRFMSGGEQSPVGRTATAPAADAAAPKLRLALASCAHYEQGYFANYRAMADDDCDLMLHVGDYIYESSWGENRVRRFGAPEPITLEDYRIRHALYRTDPDLQKAHAAAPWIVTWDDHEVENDYATNLSENDDPLAFFRARRAAAYQAYYEHMPLPRTMVPMGQWMRIYTRVQWGALADFLVLDDRQYRSAHPCPPAGKRGSTQIPASCAARNDPNATLLGRAQERWLEYQLQASTCRWNLLTQQTLLVQKDGTVGHGESFSSDGWDGYTAARTRLLAQLQAKRNPVVLGGDVHCNYIANVHATQGDMKSKIIASEFCGTSITSQAWPNEKIQKELADNPHILLGNSAHRGYVRMDVTPKQVNVALQVAKDVRDPQTTISTLANFVVKDGVPGPQRT